MALIPPSCGAAQAAAPDTRRAKHARRLAKLPAAWHLEFAGGDMGPTMQDPPKSPVKIELGRIPPGLSLRRGFQTFESTV